MYCEIAVYGDYEYDYNQLIRLLGWTGNMTISNRYLYGILCT